MKLFRFNFISFLCLVILTFFATTAGAQYGNLSPTPIRSFQEASFSSYELFWPIAAGRVMGDQMYPFKLFKENLREIFIFSDLKKAEYNITLSEKRTVEAEKLFTVKKDYTKGKMTLDAAKQKQEKAGSFLKKADGKDRYIGDVKNRMIRSFKNQRDVLSNIVGKISEDQKPILDDSISHLTSLLKSFE